MNQKQRDSFPDLNSETSSYLYHNSDDSSKESDSSSFQTDSDYLPNLISQRQEYTAGTSITSVTSHQSDITVPWDNYDQLGDVSYSLQYDQPD